MFRNKSASVHQFAMVPRADIPRSQFRMEKTYKSTFDGGGLIPFFVEEVLPGDTFRVSATVFCRLATPMFPVLDNSQLETFFFFVPNRLVWDNWQRFMGEQDNPDDPIDFLIPQVSFDFSVIGFDELSIYAYMGIPSSGQIAADAVFGVNALPLRGYNLIYNDWFRDQNLQDSLDVPRDNGPDDPGMYQIQFRNKKHDYFTGSLLAPQKGNVSVPLPLGGLAPVVSDGTSPLFWSPTQTRQAFLSMQSGSATPAWTNSDAVTGNVNFGVAGTDSTGLNTDLSEATAGTINQLRQAFQIQRLLERDARGGTRYTEIVRSHFGVVSPDARLQRPEYLGGGRSRISINPVAQTSASNLTGGDTPQGSLSAIGTALVGGHGFTQSFTEHGYVIGLLQARADLTYQQGLRKHWSRRTRYDFYFPVFAHLGEQAVLSKELYFDGDPAGDDDTVFGYQERWAEYRYLPNEITGMFRSYCAQPVDQWHYAEYFDQRPLLDQPFVRDRADLQFERSIAVQEAAGGQQFLVDAFIEVVAARPMPLYSVPGLIDHF